MIPIAVLLPLLSAIPSLVESGLKVMSALRANPETSDTVKADLDVIEASLTEIMEQVKNARLPETTDGK